MLAVLAFLVVGFCIGLYFRSGIEAAPHIAKNIDRLVLAAIWMLLFALGYVIGSNEVIMRNLHSLGFQALLISVLATSFSVVLAYLLYSVAFKNER